MTGIMPLHGRYTPLRRRFDKPRRMQDDGGTQAWEQPMRPNSRGPRSLEEQLASVTEGEGVLGGEDVYLFARPTNVRIARVGRKRRRRRTRSQERIIEDMERGRDPIANLDRVVVGFAEAPEPSFKDTPVSIRHGQHDRSPFVVSLREITFSISGDDDEYVLQSDLFDHEPEVECIPNLDLIEAIATDLQIDTPDAGKYSVQFTPTSFARAHRSVYGPLRRMGQAITGAFATILGWIRVTPKPKRTPRPKTIDLGEDLMLPEAPVRISYWRAAVVLTILTLVAMLPAGLVTLVRSLQNKQYAIAAAGEEALGALGTVPGSELNESMEALRLASARFRAADELLSSTNALAVGLASVIPSTRSNYRTARALLEVGSKSSDAAQLLAKGLQAALRDAHVSALDRLGVVAAYAEGAIPLLEEATNALAKVDVSAIPEADRDRFELMAGQVENGRLALREFIGISELLSVLLGDEAPRRYLVVFQNPNELRPTGGFMGSYAELDVYRGEIERFEIPGGGTYDLQGELLAQVIPPEPLTLVADRWEFQDSNWSPDFPTAAAKMNYFWSKSGGHTVDGIIAVNATLVERLLEITGPIDIPELEKTISADNFIEETQKAVELEYDKEENKPKKILSLLGPRLIAKLKDLSQTEYVRALASLSEAVSQKEVQIALFDPTEEQLAEQFGWNGRLKSATGDALAVIAANIAGQKTDAAIEERVEHVADIQEDGSVIDSVTISRTHNGTEGGLFQGVRNVTYFRVYVPKGSRLIFAEGFEEPAPIFFDTPREDAVTDPDEEVHMATAQSYPDGVRVWDEGDRTVIGGWSMVDPGERESITLSYRLPFTAFDIRSRLHAGLGEEVEAGRAAYTLLLTSQSGKPERELVTSLSVPEHWEAHWSYNGDAYEGAWDRDRVISTLYLTSEE